MKRRATRTICVFVLAVAASRHACAGDQAAPPPSADAYPSLQTAIDANPGRMIRVPAGDYRIDRAVDISADHTGLYGPGRIVQTNPDADILTITRASDVVIDGLTLTRADGAMDATKHGLHANECTDVTVRNVRVLNNRSQAGTINFERCTGGRIAGCDVTNYERVGVDDRTASDLYGYAFKVIDGTGILLTASSGVQITGNRIVERHLMADKATKKKFQLGEFTEGAHPTKKGRLAPSGHYANNWHQGSAIVVTTPEETHHILVRGNYIENAAQGIDLHADHLTCTDNVIDHAFIGIKCMHGSKNVIISDNNLSYIDLWGIVMMPGTASHPAEAATKDQPAKGPNFTSGNIIANNIISDIGFGYENWIWPEGSRRAISLESGQLAENPVMFDVLIQGNIVYDTGHDQILEDGKPVTVPPRYAYAVYITPKPAPRGLRFVGNIFHPGVKGVSNVPLDSTVNKPVTK